MSDQMREEFEQYMIERLVQGERGEIISGSDVIRDCKNAPDYYYHRETQGRWEAWQASRAALVVELPKYIDSFTDDDAGRKGFAVFTNKAINDCREAITKTGVRVK